MSLLEATMLICFATAWPPSIYRSFKSRTTGGKSIVFLVIIQTGYLAGFSHKILEDPDPVTFLYATNTVMVFIDILLYMRNRLLDKKRLTVQTGKTVK